MIDTIDVCYEFNTVKEYNLVFDRIKYYVKNSGVDTKYSNFIYDKSKRARYWKCYYFIPSGINTLTFWIHDGGKRSNRFLNFSIDCSRMIYGNKNYYSYNGLAKENDYNKLRKKFRDFISTIEEIIDYQVNLPEDISDWHTRRVDYTKDIVTQNINFYMELFKRGNIPRGFKKHDSEYDGFYITSDRCNFNFYDKSWEMFIRRKGNISNSIMRLEVQCKPPELRRIRKAYALSNDSRLIDYWNNKIAKNEITEAIKDVIGEYPFRKIGQLIKIVEGYPNSKQPLILIKVLAKGVFSIKDIHKIKPQKPIDIVDLFWILKMEKGLCDYNRDVIFESLKLMEGLTLRTAKYQLKKMGLSPLTIPDDAPFDILSSPIDLLD